MINKIDSLGYQVYFDDQLSSLYDFIQEHSYSRILLLVDQNTAECCLPILQEQLADLVDYDIIEVDPGEENKNIDFCIGIWKMMLDFGADRKSLLINLGGGVVTDMGGFAASTFKRGFDFVQVPTTLLSQVDASVGGKTGIDMDGVKNIIGTFTQPKAVFISSLFLQTLDRKQKISGLAEMIKHGLIQDADFYHSVKSVSVDDITSDQIRHSVQIKNNVVLVDPHEQGLRKVLNFGHTIGHAVEGYSLRNDNQPLLHGEAIAIGMICEAYLSHRFNGLPENDLHDIVHTFQTRYDTYSVARESYPALLEIMANDKKNEQEKIGFSLLSQIGQCGHGFYIDQDSIVESLDFYRKITEQL